MTWRITVDFRDAIVAALNARPRLTFAIIADNFGVSLTTVRGIARANGFSMIGRVGRNLGPQGV